MKNGGIKAVNNDDITDLLKSLKVYDQVLSGQKYCVFCNQVITVDNIDAILPVKDSIEFSCDKEDCHFKLLAKIGEK